tara:strand:- start:6917 stop:7180 length:264 start_codon:yes stop_codon:yes gene_type:complete
MKISKARLRQIIIEETEKHKQISEAEASEEDIAAATVTPELEAAAEKVAAEIENAVSRAPGGDDAGINSVLTAAVISKIRSRLLGTE